MPTGYMRFDAYLTRAGVFPYLMSGGETSYELRHPDDVFDAASLDTLPGDPVTDEHPMIPQLTSQNARMFQMGSVGTDVVVEGDKVRATLTVVDDKLIQKVESGSAQEISCGYTCKIVPEIGMYQGVKYTSRQKNIRYNHVAIVSKGRAGADVRLRADDSAMMLADAEFAHSAERLYQLGEGSTQVTEQEQGRQDAHKVKIGDSEYSVSHKDLAACMKDSQIQKLILSKMGKKKAGKQVDPEAEARGEDDPEKDDADEGAHADPAQMPAGAPKQLGQAGKLQGFPDAKQSHPEETGKDDEGDDPDMDDKKDKKKKDSADELVARRDALIEELKGARDAQAAEIAALRKATAPEALANVVSERVELLRKAESHGVRVDSAMGNLEIKKEILKTVAPSMKLDSASEQYVDGAFGTVLAMLDSQPSRGYIKLREVVTATKADAAPRSAREQMIERQQTAWNKSKSVDGKGN